MVGLMILKHRFDLSDEAVVSGLHENFVWMAFCRVPVDEARHIESSTLCKFRKRLGPEGTQAVEAGHPGPDDPGRSDPAQDHAGRHDGDGEEPLPDGRRTA